MFELNEARVRVANVNPRAEKHGEENKLAVDIKIEATLPGDTLNAFDPGLRAALYRDLRKGEQADLPGIGDNKFGAVRFPLVKPVVWDEEFTGYAMSIGTGLGLSEPVRLSDVTLRKFVFEPMQGGSLGLTFSIVAHPDTDDAGVLCATIQDDAVLTLTPPAAAEQKQAA